MPWLFCWRCSRDMPMLDEQEFAGLFPLYRDALRLHKEVEGNPEHPRRASTLEEVYEPLLSAYKQLTGFPETNPNAVIHHRLSLYGSPCVHCGKPLRTPRASKCMSCGAPMQ